MVAQIQDEKRSRMHAIYSNGGYLQTEDGLKARDEEIRVLEEQFDEMVKNILDPEPEVDLSDNPFFAAGRRAVEKTKWDLGLAQPIQDMQL